MIEIESEWSGRRRERRGLVPRVKIAPALSPKEGDKRVALSAVEGRRPCMKAIHSLKGKRLATRRHGVLSMNDL